VTIAVPDFSALTPIQFAVILLIVAAVDFLSGVIGALFATHTFSWDALLNVLQSHGVFRILPIGALFAIGVVGAIPLLCYAADGFLALYVVETIQSAISNLSAPQLAGPQPTPPAVS